MNDLQQDIDWAEIYHIPFKVTQDTKLQWLQYRISHRILTTNKFLAKIKLVNSSLCTFCNFEDETIEHLFWNCVKTCSLLESLKQIMESHNINLIIEKHTFLLGKCCGSRMLTSDCVENVILLNIKSYIYKTKCMKGTLNLTALINCLKDYYNVTKYRYILKNKLEDCETAWKDWKNVFQWNDINTINP